MATASKTGQPTSNANKETGNTAAGGKNTALAGGSSVVSPAAQASHDKLVQAKTKNDNTYGVTSEQAAANREKIGTTINKIVDTAKGLYDYYTSGNIKGGGGGGYYEEGGGEDVAPVERTIESDPSTGMGSGNPGAADATKAIMDAAKAGVPEADIASIDHINTDYQRQLMDMMREEQEKQIQNSSDYAVERGVNELNRNLQDSQAQFQSMRDQIDRDEQMALDNQVLYTEARGDRGGIGQAQYGSIQNAAATNRLSVNKAQTQLATDTARQIADLRAQGEFEKADKLLEVSQSYLSQLMDLYNYAQSTNLSIDQFNRGLDQWLADYRMSISQYLTNTELNAANVTGAFSNGTLTNAAYQQEQERIANAASALIQAGVTPTVEQLAMLGWNSRQALDYLDRNFPEG